MNIAIISSEELRDVLIQYKHYKNIIIGYSIDSKKLLQEYSFQVDYIVEQNNQLVSEKYQIISYDKFNMIDDSNIIVCGNHIISIIEYIYTLNKQHNAIIIYNYSSIPFFKSHITIDAPSYPKKNKNQSQLIFIRKLIDILLVNNISFSVNPDLELDMFEDLKVDNEILLSYHTRGPFNNNIIRYKNSYLTDYVVVDKTGYSGWHSLSTKNIDSALKNLNKKDVNKCYQMLYAQNVMSNKSFYEQSMDTNFKFPKKFIFFPLQVYSDSVMDLSYFNPLFLINYVAEKLYDIGIKLVIKPHPLSEDEELILLINKLNKENKVILYRGTIHNAISKAATIYTINSGVGFESLLHLKPVVTFGKVEYSHVTQEVTTIKELNKLLCSPIIKLTIKDKVRIKQFLYYYRQNYLINLNNNEILNFIKKTLIENYVIQLHCTNNLVDKRPYIKRHEWDDKNNKVIMIIGIPKGYRRYMKLYFPKYNILYVETYTDISIKKLLVQYNVKKIYCWNTISDINKIILEYKNAKLYILKIGIVSAFGLDKNTIVPMSLTILNADYNQQIKKDLLKLTKKDLLKAKTLSAKLSDEFCNYNIVKEILQKYSLPQTNEVFYLIYKKYTLYKFGSFSKTVKKINKQMDISNFSNNIVRY